MYLFSHVYLCLAFFSCICRCIIMIACLCVHVAMLNELQNKIESLQMELNAVKVSYPHIFCGRIP